MLKLLVVAEEYMEGVGLALTGVEVDPNEKDIFYFGYTKNINAL